MKIEMKIFEEVGEVAALFVKQVLIVSSAFISPF